MSFRSCHGDPPHKGPNLHVFAAFDTASFVAARLTLPLNGIEAYQPRHGSP
ncbi:hypothetical protein [Rhodobacter lacus]|uniref:Uncharacterized protein n=1 Tax=Rhodobacter lacus TaxID=1641972 RepID=A0ABW5ABM0_9RHOB